MQCTPLTRLFAGGDNSAPAWSSVVGAVISGFRSGGCLARGSEKERQGKRSSTKRSRDGMLRIEIIAAVFSCHVGRGDAGGGEDDGGNAACRGNDLLVTSYDEVMMIMHACLSVFRRYSSPSWSSYRGRLELHTPHVQTVCTRTDAKLRAVFLPRRTSRSHARNGTKALMMMVVVVAAMVMAVMMRTMIMIVGRPWWCWWWQERDTNDCREQCEAVDRNDSPFYDDAPSQAWGTIGSFVQG